MTYTKILQYTVGPVGAAAVSLVTLPILAHYFSPEDVGRYSLLQVFLSLSIMLFSLGLHQSFVREYYGYTDKPSLVLMASLPCMVALSLACMFYLFTPFSISSLLVNIENKSYSLWIVFSVFLSVLINQYAHVLRMQERALLYSASTILPRLVFVVAVLASPLFFDGFGFDNIIYAVVISLLLTLLLLIALIEDVRHSFTGRINVKFQYNMLAFGLPLTVGGLAFWGMASIDRFLLKYYSTLSEVAIYSLAVSFAAVGSVLTSVFGTIWHPIVYRWDSEGIEQDKMQLMLDAVLVIVCCAWSLAGLFSWLAGLVLPEHYHNVIYLLPLCIAVPLLYLLSEITQVGINLKRKSVYAMLIALSALAVNITANIVLLETFASLGAALASAAAFAFFLVARTEISHRLMPFFEKKALYSLVLVYLTLSVIFSLHGRESVYYHMIWLLPLPFVLYRTCILLPRLRSMFN